MIPPPHQLGHLQLGGPKLDCLHSVHYTLLYCCDIIQGHHMGQKTGARPQGGSRTNPPHRIVHPYHPPHKRVHHKVVLGYSHDW